MKEAAAADFFFVKSINIAMIKSPVIDHIKNSITYGNATLILTL